MSAAGTLRVILDQACDALDILQRNSHDDEIRAAVQRACADLAGAYLRLQTLDAEAPR